MRLIDVERELGYLSKNNPASVRKRDCGALDRNRTDTVLLPLDFESSASTSSATRASKGTAILAHSGQLLPDTA